MEIKFALTGAGWQRLVQTATFVSKKVLVDVYYDTLTYALTTQDYWLRQRNRTWELKVPMHRAKSISERVTDQYDEVSEETAIASVLHLPSDQPLVDVLVAEGYTPVVQITTSRTKYTLDDIVIDIDETDFGVVRGELELLVADLALAEEAQRRLTQVVETYGLESVQQDTGKVTEYIRRFRPDHYAALVQAGILTK